MRRILFVCHGNICRSPMAEYNMKDLVRKADWKISFQIASAATSREEIAIQSIRLHVVNWQNMGLVVTDMQRIKWSIGL